MESFVASPLEFVFMFLETLSTLKRTGIFTNKGSEATFAPKGPLKRAHTN